ncbi:NAD(P)/FAD-dependent oxidoreductase [Gemmobacter lanyuensis]
MAPVLTARAFPRHPGVSGWVAMLSPRVPAQALDGRQTADVVVIGAGFAGLAAARRMFQLDPSLRILMLEAGQVGEGPAGRNSGFIIDLPMRCLPTVWAVIRRIMRGVIFLITARPWRLCRTWPRNRAGGPRSSIRAGDIRSRGGEGDHHLQEYAAQLTALGEAHRLLSSAETAALTGSSAFSAALYTPGTALIQPAAFVRACADALQARRLRLHEQSPVRRITRQGAGWQVETAQGQVATGRVVLAVNGHAQSFGLLPGRLMHVFTYASLTRPFDPRRLGGARDWAATPALPMGTTLRRIAGADGDRLLVRSRYSYNPGLTVGEGALRRAGQLHDRKLASRFPALAGWGWTIAGAGPWR